MADGAKLDLVLQRRFGAFELDVDETIPVKGVTALFGPSGSGKSSILRIISGLERGQGRVQFGGALWEDVKTGAFVPAHKRDVGLVFQDGRLFAHLSVEQNLRFALKKVNSVETRWSEILSALNLAPLLASRTDALSGGERQRVALGRALLARPRLLLLDEPLASLDKARRQDILPYLKRLATEFKVPTIFVSHSVEEVAHLADHIVLLADGRVTVQGPAKAILERPDIVVLESRFEAGATVEAKVLGHDRVFCLTRLDLGGQDIFMPMLEALDVGEQVPLRLRARDIAVSLKPLEGVSIRNQLRGRVERIVLEEGSAYAEITVAIGGAVIRARLTRHAVSDLKLAPGKEVVALIKSVALDRRRLLPRGPG